MSEILWGSLKFSGGCLKFWGGVSEIFGGVSEIFVWTVDSTHPTGIHSCFFSVFVNKYNLSLCFRLILS